MTPLLEVNYSSKGKEKVDGNKPPNNVGKSKKGKKSTIRTNPKTKVQGMERNLSSATAVVVLIILQRSAIYPNTWLTCTRNLSKRLEKAKGSYEAHFNTAFDEATTSDKRPDEAAKPSLTVEDYIDKENMIVEYNSNDIFRDQN
jgi:hypothetical protein